MSDNAIELDERKLALPIRVHGLSKTDLPVLLADWLELNSIIGSPMSKSDLMGALKVPGIEGRESIADDVERVIDVRRTKCRNNYPFDGLTPKLSEHGRVRSEVYGMCLFCSLFNASYQNGASLFEELCSNALKNFLGNGAKSKKFGAPRRELSDGFEDALNSVLSEMCEGRCANTDELHTGKDGGVDLIAWKNVIDNSRNKLVIFGQCATGNSWTSEKGEVRTRKFLDKWVEGRYCSPDPVPSVFVPHRLGDADLIDFGIDYGIIFDRFRICRWVNPNEIDPLLDKISGWMVERFHREPSFV